MKPWPDSKPIGKGIAGLIRMTAGGASGRVQAQQPDVRTVTEIDDLAQSGTASTGYDARRRETKAQQKPQLPEPRRDRTPLPRSSRHQRRSASEEERAQLDQWESGLAWADLSVPESDTNFQPPTTKVHTPPGSPILGLAKHSGPPASSHSSASSAASSSAAPVRIDRPSETARRHQRQMSRPHRRPSS